MACPIRQSGYVGHVKNAKISELKDNLSRFLAYVRRGGTVRVFDRDSPIADITPCVGLGADGEPDSTLAALERDGVLLRAKRHLPDDFLTRRLPRAKASVLDALLDERREGR
jgi:antitoxin (DNA-binding transcriptional repressor) of toxin-antitoxin stability system